MTRWNKSVRPKLGSLGMPTIRREIRRRFWRAIAAGAHTAAASAAAGVSQPAGQRWFVEAGGVRPLSLTDPSSRYLSFVEREEIAILFAQQIGVREIARRVGRNPSTISRELRRNASTRSAKWDYRASTAQWHAERRLERPKVSKLATNERLREHVQDKLSGPGRWSPEQIARRLELDFPEDESMRVSHETIYRSLYVQGRGALRRELTECLRTGRAVRKPKRRQNVRGKRAIPPEIMISERPPEVEDRAVPGHWESQCFCQAAGASAGRGGSW